MQWRHGEGWASPGAACGEHPCRLHVPGRKVEEDSPKYAPGATAATLLTPMSSVRPLRQSYPELIPYG